MIVMAEKARENKKMLVKKGNKAVMAEVTRVSTAIDISNKYRWVISNANIDTARDLGLTNIKKY